MKILIWALSILITSIVAATIRTAGITLGAIPMMILYLPLFFVTPKLCKKWEEHKAQIDPHKKKISESTIPQESAGSSETQDVIKGRMDSFVTPSKKNLALKKKLHCRQCGAELPEDSAFCNKCGAKIESKPINNEPPMYIDSLFLVNKEHVGKYVQLIGNYSWSLIKKEPLKCNISQYSMRGERSVSVELLEPLPEYVVNCPVGECQPIIMRGILYEITNPYHEFVLRNAEYQGYWRDEEGRICCDKESCGYKCSKDCPIYLNKLGKEKYDEYNRDEAIELFNRAVFLAPDFAEAWSNLGYAYLDSQKYNDAYEAFCEAEEYGPNNERTMYGEIVSFSKVGRQKEARVLFEKYKRLFPEENAETLSNIIGGNLPKLQLKPQLTDDEYVRLLVEKGFEEFWKALLAEKELTFVTESCKYTGKMYGKRCERLKEFVCADVRMNRERLLRFRKALADDNVQNANSMLLFDAIDEYERRYIKY